MVNLVKAVEESWKAGKSKSNQKLMMKSLKKQLNTNKAEINKLRQSTVKPHWMLAPLHAAILTNNIEILKEILETKGADIDIVATFRNEDQKVEKYGALDMITFMLDGADPDIEIVKLILNNMKTPFLHPTVSGISPKCIIHFVHDEALEVLDLVHTKADQFDTLSPLNTLAVSIWQDKPRVFSHVLPQAEKYFDHVVPLIVEGKSFTKKDMVVNLAKIYERTEMSEQLQRVVGDMNGNNVVKDSNVAKGDVIFDEVQDSNVAKSDDIVDEVKDSDFAKGDDIVNEVLKDSNIAKGDDIVDEEVDQQKVVSDESQEEKNEQSQIGNNSEEDEMTKYCWSCFEVGRFKCSGCRKARYCGESCQGSDWKRHMVYCLVMMNRIAFRQFRCMSPSIFT